MKTLIFEGIATSGKSTLIDKLAGQFKDKKVRIVPEEESLEPIIENQDVRVSINFLKKLLEEVYREKNNLIIFDRLYLTHVFRTSRKVEDFRVVEKVLEPHRPVTIFLKVDESAIARRVKKAWEHRDPEWEQYVRTKGDTMEEIADYYIQQQREQERLIQSTAFPYKIYDTTGHGYDAILADIIQFSEIQL